MNSIKYFLIFICILTGCIKKGNKDFQTQPLIQYPVLEIGENENVLVVLKGDSFEKYLDTSLYKGIFTVKSKNKLIIVDNPIFYKVREATLYSPIIYRQVAMNSHFPSFNSWGAIPINKNLNIFCNVQRLYIRFHNIVEVFPQYIKDLKKLKLLDVSGNDLSFLDTTVGYFQNLETLYVQNNSIGIIPDTVLKLPKLKYLDIRDNYLTNSFVDSIKKVYTHIQIIENNSRDTITFEGNDYALELTFEPYPSRFPDAMLAERFFREYGEKHTIWLEPNKEYISIAEMQNIQENGDWSFRIYEKDRHVYSIGMIDDKISIGSISETFYNFRFTTTKQKLFFSIQGSPNIPTLKIYRKIEN